MRMFNLIFILLLITLFCFNCEWIADRVYRIRIKNNSSDTIYFYGQYIYPDTTLILKKPVLNIAFPFKDSYLDSKKKWEDVSPSDTISIFIFNKDTVDNYSWDKITKGYKILKRYDISIKDLERLNWIIMYQPTEDMDVKMWP